MAISIYDQFVLPFTRMLTNLDSVFKKAEADLKAQIMGKLGTAGKARTQGFFINLSVTPENPGRPPKPDELIGKRKEVRKLIVKESAAA